MSTKNPMGKLLAFLDKLEAANLAYHMEHIRDSILIEVAVPGERWEVEFFEDCHVEFERFVSTGSIGDERQLEMLFAEQANDL